MPKYIENMENGKIIGIAGWGCDSHAYKDIILWTLAETNWPILSIHAPENFLKHGADFKNPDIFSADDVPGIASFLLAHNTFNFTTGRQELLDYFRKVTEKPIILFAWSLGALMALRMALTRPEAIRGMILLSPTARMTRDGDYPGVAERVLRQMRRRFDEDPLAVLEDFHRKSWLPLDDEGRARELARRVYSKDADKAPLAAGLDYLASEDLRAHVHKISCPILILHGDADAIIDPACGRWLADRLPDCRFELLRGHGHMLPQTSFNACAIPIRKFLDERLR